MPVSAQLFRVLAFLCLLLVSVEFAPAQASNAEDDSPFKIEVNVNRILVPVVVRDKKDQAVGDLTKEDFQIFDDGKPLPISHFAIEKHSLTATATQSGDPSSPPAPQSAATQRFVVFLFDDMHLNAQDLARSQKAAVKVVTEGLLPRDIIDVVSLSGRANSGLTRDRARLQSTILSLSVNNLYRNDGGGCPNLDYYQADQMIEKRSEVALQAAVQQVFACSPGMDQQRDLNVAQRIADIAAQRLIAIGQLDTQNTYNAIQSYVQRISHLPGEKILILVSPGFLSLDNKGLTMETHIIDLAAQSNITISSLDSRGLYTSQLQASDKTSGSGNTDRLLDEYRRNSATQVEDAMAALAEGTGGTFFHNSNDLPGGLATLTAAPEYLYILEVTPANSKPDGNYHHLKVKLDRPGLQLKSRHGYFSPKPEKAKK